MHMKMSVSAPISKFLIILTILLLYFSSIIDATCLAREKQALIEFKKDLKGSSTRLSSWTDHHVDCCKWEGVVCSNKSGNVIQLHLQDPGDSALSGKISPSLLNLTQLHYLDLSLNDFEGIPIPSFLGSLKSLRYLNLSRAGFQGMVPHQLGNLSSLLTLSIGGNNDIYSEDSSWLQVDNLQWLARLTNLEHLGMNDVNLTAASNWLEVINMIPSLVELHLSSCDPIQIPQLSYVNFSSLTILDLSRNFFESFLPRWIFGLNALVSLDLSFNYFDTPWTRGPWNLTSLKHLDLSYNQLYLYGSLPRELFNLKNLISLNLGSNLLDDSSFPDGIQNLSSLKSLDLSDNILNLLLPITLSGLISLDVSYNSLQGSIPNTIANISNLQYLDLSYNDLNSSMPKWLYNCTSLESIILNNNQLEGAILDDIVQLKKLWNLDLSDNSLSGSLPLDLGRLSSLESLTIDRNKITGTLPESLGQLSKLESLDISDNLIEGIVTESVLDNLTSLRYFYASRNSLALKASASWIPRAQFEILGLASWNLGPKFPTWLQSQKHIFELDLSLTGISGIVPSWFWNLSTQLQVLNLSHNQLHSEEYVGFNSIRFRGSLPQLNSQTMDTLDLSDNLFSGSISHFLCDVKNNNLNLRYLVLGDNFLSGEIPDCWMNWPNLFHINLNNNNFTGNIPRSIINLKKLQELHLSNNSLSGQIHLTV